MIATLANYLSNVLQITAYILAIVWMLAIVGLVWSWYESRRARLHN